MKTTILKEIFDYLIRVFIFLLLNRRWAINLYVSLVAPMLQKIEGDEWILFAAFSYILYWYITIKICGLFKKLDKLNFLIGIVIVLLIDILFNHVTFMTDIQINPLRFSYHYQKGIIFIVLPCYILYKILHWQGKKYPNTCGKIGYYTSLEFWKDIIKK